MSAPVTLSGPQKRHLRALAHPLEPVVIVGKEGVTEGVLAALDQALTDHELVKVRLPQLEREERVEMGLALEQGARAAIAATTGRIVLLYRRHPQKPTIRLPRG